MNLIDPQFATLPRSRKIFLGALFLAALSLALYMPYKLAVSFEKIEQIYGPWFIEGAVVASAGLILALRPLLATRLPLPVRGGASIASGLWMYTGLRCTPHLVKLTSASLAQGLFRLIPHVAATHFSLGGGNSFHGRAKENARLAGIRGDDSGGRRKSRAANDLAVEVRAIAVVVL